MPNIITHTIFCEEVYKTITNQKYKDIIERNRKEYMIGSNGPDFLFFHDIIPVWKKQDGKIPMIGTTFHRQHINKFYQVAIKAYQKEKDGYIKNAMAAYIIGHYLHWQLDSTMHPYVVYKTGFGDEMSKYYHHRFESMMDTILLDYYHNESIKTYQTYKICKRSKNSVEAISKIYIPCVKECQEIDIDKDIIKKSLEDWKQAQTYLYDPKGIKYGFLKIYEFIIKKPYLVSGNMIRVKMDKKNDILNNNHDVWLHPCLQTASKESVIDLMDRAIHDSQIGLPLLFSALDGNQSKPLLAFIDNKTYANGIKGKAVRKYKNVIYNK